MGRRLRMEEINVTGILAERKRPDGKRAISLRASERRELSKQKRVETAVALFLDINTDHTWEEIAKEIGMSVRGLRDLTKTQEFMQVYDEHFGELGHDPRLRASQTAISDMLPAAVRELRTMITSPITPPSVKLKAIEDVLRLNGVKEPSAAQTDRQELADFLKNAGIGSDVNIAQINVALPPAFEKAEDYIEGEFVDRQPLDPARTALPAGEADPHSESNT